MTFAKRISKVLTPDMVSFWLPSGQDVIIDMMGRNPGKGYGVSKQVKTGKDVFNPDVGWNLDGTNDYIKIPSPIQIPLGNSVYTMGLWALLEDHVPDRGYGYNCGLFARGNGATRQMVSWQVKAADGSLWINFYASDHDTGWDFTVNKWYFLVNVYDQSKSKLYVNGAWSSDMTPTGALNIQDTDIILGDFKHLTGWYAEGSLALPFIANTAWSAEKINNFYEITKGLFSPRQ